MKRLLISLLLFTAVLDAAPRTFTDQFGRTITAELISVEGDQIRIRREDGLIFTLATSKLTKEDQQYIRKWAASQPKTDEPTTDVVSVDASKIRVNLSRVKTGTRNIAKWDGYQHKHEDWAYTIELFNEHVRSLAAVRIEYNLFAHKFPDAIASSDNALTGTEVLQVIGGREKASIRTVSAEVCKRNSTYFRAGSGEMRGLWYRIYVDDVLVIEASSPETLKDTEKWTNASKRN